MVMIMTCTDVLSRTAVQAEKDLLKTLADKEPTFAEIAHCLAE